MLGRYGDVDTAPAYASSKTLADVLAGSGVFDEFRSAINAIGNADLLTGDSAYTLFVPSDDAFAALTEAQRAELRDNPEALAGLVSKHIVPARCSATDLMQMSATRSIDGSSTPVGSGASRDGHSGFGSSDVIKTNIHAANGIVHVVDQISM